MFFNHCFLMYIDNMDQTHSIHCSNDQVHPFHDLVNGVVRSLSPTDHHRALTHRTVRDFIFEPVNHKRDAFLHKVVQVGGHSGHLCHHPNLSKKSQSQGHEKKLCLQDDSVPLPKTGDPSYDGSGGSHFFGGYLIVQ